MVMFVLRFGMNITDCNVSVFMFFFVRLLARFMTTIKSLPRRSDDEGVLIQTRISKCLIASLEVPERVETV